MKTVVIKETNVIENTPCSAWFVRRNSVLHGQFHSEAGALAFAMEEITKDWMRHGRALDQDSMAKEIVFEENTAYRGSSL